MIQKPTCLRLEETQAVLLSNLEDERKNMERTVGILESESAVVSRAGADGSRAVC